MICKYQFFILYVFLSIQALFAQDPNFHIYLALGQSNMDGAGDIEAQDRQAVSTRFKNLSAVKCDKRLVGTWYTGDTPLCRCTSGLSPVDYFGRTLLSELPSEISIGVVVVAVAGSKIELFDKDTYKAYADTAPSWMQGWIDSYNRYPYGRLLEMAKIAQKEGVIKGILLHQGESNSGEGSRWLAKVQKIYNDLIKDLNLDPTKVPFLAGELAGQAEGGICWGHNQTIAKLNTVIPNAHLISSAGLAQKGDGFHFTSAAYRTFGARYAEKMLSLLDKTPVETIPFPRDTIYNGSFSKGTAGWVLNVWSGAAEGSTTNGEYKISIGSAGAESYQIQLIQPGITLVQGKSYEITFDAYAASPRTLELNVEKDDSPWTSYLVNPQQFDLTTAKQSFSHKFTMNEITDLNSRISFNAGASTGTVYLDNVRILPNNGPVVSIRGSKNLKISIKKNGASYDIPSFQHKEKAVFALYDLHGKCVLKVNLNAFSQSIDLNGLAKGLYLARIHLNNK